MPAPRVSAPGPAPRAPARPWLAGLTALALAGLAPSLAATLRAPGVAGARRPGQDPAPPGVPADRPPAPALDDLPRPLAIAVPLGLEVDYEGVVLPDAAQAELGRRLFFDPRLSRDATVACATCHRPEHAFGDDRARSIGVDGQATELHTPALVNRALGGAFMWDGRAHSLEEQALLPLENPLEMDLDPAQAVARLRADDGYVRAFEEAFGAGPDRERLARALAAFVRTLTHGDTPVDRFLEGDVAALTADERSGMWVFEGRGKCWRCHTGANFTDEAFHNTGVGLLDGEPAPGRAAVTGDPADRGAFKTPSLRGLAVSAPYMHDGSLATLEEVVAFYRRGGNANAARSERLEPLELSDEDARHLVAFLRALTRR